jgi:hypothetical protein
MPPTTFKQEHALGKFHLLLHIVRIVVATHSHFSHSVTSLIDKRMQVSKRIREKYSDRIPVSFERSTL